MDWIVAADEPTLAVGLLTRTLAQSPVVRQILPFTSWPDGRHQVLLVGHDHIQRFEILDGGQIRRIISIQGLGGSILSATLLHTNNSTPLETKIRPRNILALALDIGDLLLIDLDSEPDRRYPRVLSSYPIPRSLDPLEKVGKLLAVDPRGRAIAVAASEGGLLVFDVVWSVTADDEPFKLTPELRQRGPVLDHAYILHMAFLQPLPDLSDGVILLLVKVTKKKLVLQRIEWTTTVSDPIIDSHDPQRIHIGSALPDLLVPIDRPAEFILASPTGLFQYKNILSGHADQEMIRLPPRHALPLPIRQDSVEDPSWTAWTTSNAACQPYGNCFLARNDGLIVALNTSVGRNGSSVRVVGTGVSTMHVGAMATLDSSAQQSRIIATSDNGGDGGIFQVHTHSHVDDSEPISLETLQSIPNWAINVDVLSSNLARSNETSSRISDGLFATSHHKDNGVIVELRPGITASLAFIFELAALRNVSSIYPVTDSTQGVIKFLFTTQTTSPEITNLVVSLDEDGVMVDDGSIQEEIDLQSSAPWATKLCLLDGTSANPCIHITAHSAQRLDDLGTAQIIHKADQSETIVLAAADPTIGALLLVTEKADVLTSGTSSHWLTLINLQSMSPEARIILEKPLTAIEVFSITKAQHPEVSSEREAFVVTATASGSLSISVLKDVPQPMVTMAMPVHNGSAARCDSIRTIKENSKLAGSGTRIFCALRDGRVEVFLFLAGSESQGHVLHHQQTIVLGALSASLIEYTSPMETSHTALLAACDSNLFMIRIPHSAFAQCPVTPVWVTDNDAPAFQHETITAMTQIRGSVALNGVDLAWPIVLTMGSRFLIAGIYDESSRAVPRSLALHSQSYPAIPKRLIYSSTLGHFVTASDETIRFEESSSGATQTTRSVIQIITAMTSPDQEEPMRFPLQAGEQAYALAEWIFTSEENKKYVFIMIGTSIEQPADATGERSRLCGRVHMIQPSLRRRKVESVLTVNTLRFDGPVYALAMTSDIGFVVGHGKEVAYYEYSRDDRKWKIVSFFSLTSPAVSIVVDMPRITIATAKNSLMVLDIDRAGSMRMRSVDSAPAASLHHLTLPLLEAPSAADSPTALRLLTTKTAQIRGLLSPRDSTPARTLFTATLPRSLSRIRAHNVSLDPLRAAYSIVGIAADGALVGLRPLDAHAWARLKFLEELIRRDEVATNPAIHRSRRPSTLSLGLNGLARYAAESPAAYEARTGIPDGEWARRTSAPAVDTAPRPRPDGWSLLRTCARPDRWRPADMHVDGDVLGRLVDVQGDDGDAEERLRGVLARERGRGGDRVGDFVRERYDEEVRLVRESVALVREALLGWGFW